MNTPSQIHHIEKHIDTLKTRAAITRHIRDFFWSRGYTEYETPLLLALPGQEPYLSPMEITFHNEKGKNYKGFLHTSPEYTLKKLIAGGAGNCFSICKTFRDHESFGGSHNPEFTLLEWYHLHTDLFGLMDEAADLIVSLAKQLGQTPPTIKRLHMKEVWRDYAKIDLDNALDPQTLVRHITERGRPATENEPYEDLFYKIFLNDIEPNLPKSEVTMIYGYPACMAALSEIDKNDTRYAQRFEIYWAGMELANAFQELTNGEEQKKRLEKEKEDRGRMGKTTFAVDEDFISAVNSLPPCSGIALGVDRLLMALLSCQNIDDVLVLPASKLFSS